MNNIKTWGDRMQAHYNKEHSVQCLPASHFMREEIAELRAALATKQAAGVPEVTEEELDRHIDAVLRASGSALRHYSMQKTKDDMRAAMRAAIERKGN